VGQWLKLVQYLLFYQCRRVTTTRQYGNEERRSLTPRKPKGASGGGGNLVRV